MRPLVAERGKPDFNFNAVAYVAIGGEPEFAEAVAHHRRYYPVLPVPAEQAFRQPVAASAGSRSPSGPLRPFSPWPSNGA